LHARLEKPVSFFRIASGATQLLVGPASRFFREQINVRCSMRATSAGLERLRKQPGRFAGFKGMKVPLRTSRSLRAFFSFSLPSHQYTASGRHSRAISFTQAMSRVCGVVFMVRFVSTGVAPSVMSRLTCRGIRTPLL